MVAANRRDCVLDAGCGTGFYTAEFFKKGASAIGIDFSEGMLKQARRRCPTGVFKKVNLNRNLPFPNSSFTKINCAQVLKHVKNLAGAVREFARVLKPKGILTFSVTHPEMKWDDYKMKSTPTFILSQESDIFHYRFADYIDAINLAGLKLSAIRQVPIGLRLMPYLTAASYKKVKGQFQVVIFQARKG